MYLFFLHFLLSIKAISRVMNLSGFRSGLENPNFPTAAFLTRVKRASRFSVSDPSSAFSQIINYIIEKEMLAPKSFQTNSPGAGRQAGLQVCSSISHWVHCFPILLPVCPLFLKGNGGRGLTADGGKYIFSRENKIHLVLILKCNCV